MVIIPFFSSTFKHRAWYLEFYDTKTLNQTKLQSNKNQPNQPHLIPPESKKTTPDGDRHHQKSSSREKAFATDVRSLWGSKG